MKIAGLVAEFNPFHYGHKYLIEKIKEDSADYIIVAMSPNFVMRGEPSFLNKFDKTKIALDNGVDLIAEIPTIYTIESADVYAKRAVEILDRLKVTDLYFGVENDNFNLFYSVVDALSSIEYQEYLKTEQKKGLSFSAASKNALVKISRDFEEILSGANNLLSIYYLLSIKKLNSKIIPHFIKRIDSNYFDDLKEGTIIQSASALRKENNLDTINKFVPYDIKKYSLVSKEGFFYYIKYKILSMSKDELKEIKGVSEGLENKIKDIADVKDYESLVSKLVSKRNRETKINRVLMCILLNIKKTEVNNNPLKYIRILGFNGLGREYLNIIKNDVDNVYTTVKRDRDDGLYREIEFTKIYSLINGDDLEKREYYPIIID